MYTFTEKHVCFHAISLTGVIHGNMHVIVLSCTHLQKNMYVSMYFLFFSAHF